MSVRGGDDAVIMSLIASGYFEVRADGTIWRMKHRMLIRGRGIEVRDCEPRRAEHRTTLGYLQIRATIDGRRYIALAHRVVYRVFVGPIPSGLTINHYNGAKADNRPGNLELATTSEQAIHARRVLGRTINLFGEDHPNSRLTDVNIADIRRRRASGEPLKAIAGDYAIAFQTVSKIARGTARALPTRAQ